MKKKRVLMLLSNQFEPDRRVFKEAKSLVAGNYDVTILCLDRGSELDRQEVVQGIKVRRIKMGTVKSGNIFSMARALFLFYYKVFRQTKNETYQVIHCHDFDTMLIGWILKRRYKVPLVYDMHDLYSGYFYNAVVKRIVDGINRFFSSVSDLIIIVNDHFKPLLMKHERKSIVIMNVPLKQGAKLSNKTSSGFFYAGRLCEEREMAYCLEVLSSHRRYTEIAGGGPFLQRYKEMRWPHINLLGWITPAQVDERMEEAYCILALYDITNTNNLLATPNKLFQSMKFGKPVIASAGTVMAELIKNHRFGAVVNYGDKTELIRAIADVDKNYAEYAKNGLDACKKSYNWEIMEERLLAAYDELTGSKSS